MTGAVGPSIGLKDILHQLVDYVTENFYPEVMIMLVSVDINIYINIHVDCMHINVCIIYKYMWIVNICCIIYMWYWMMSIKHASQGLFLPHDHHFNICKLQVWGLRTADLYYSLEHLLLLLQHFTHPLQHFICPLQHSIHPL